MMTQRLEYLQWLWEDYVKSLLCFIWSQLNLSSITWYKSTSPGNVLTTGLLAVLGSFPNQVLSISLKLGWRILPSKQFVETDVFPITKIQFWEISNFLCVVVVPHPPPKKVLLENSWLAPVLSTDEVNWPLASFKNLCLFISKQLDSWSSGQEIAKNPRLHLNSAFNCNLHWVQFWNNLNIEDVVSTTYWTHWTSHMPKLLALHKT